MSRSKEEVYNEITLKHLGNNPNGTRMDIVYDAMDIYFTERSMELLSFLSKHNVECEVDTEGKEVFYYKGELISKEKLFENFL